MFGDPTMPLLAAFFYLLAADEPDVTEEPRGHDGSRRTVACQPALGRLVSTTPQQLVHAT